MFRLEGVVRPPDAAEAWEYDVVVALYDEKGVELAREVVHVGALRAPASRKCVVSIDAYPSTGVMPAETARVLPSIVRRTR